VAKTSLLVDNPHLSAASGAVRCSRGTQCRRYWTCR